MFLSQLTLDSRMRSRQLRKDVASPYEMHRTVMKSLSRFTSEDVGRVLWRLDSEQHGNCLRLYVLSNGKPDWSAFSKEMPGYLSGPVLPPKEYPPMIPPGTLLRFRLRANPTRRDGKTGKRLGLVEREAQLDWLHRKAASCGFTLYSTDIVRDDGPRSLSKGQKGGRNLALLSVCYDGVLRVTDAEAFRMALQSGIGSGKAFGFGLLSIAPCK